MFIAAIRNAWSKKRYRRLTEEAFLCLEFTREDNWSASFDKKTVRLDFIARTNQASILHTLIIEIPFETFGRHSSFSLTQGKEATFTG